MRGSFTWWASLSSSFSFSSSTVVFLDRQWLSISLREMKTPSQIHVPIHVPRLAELPMSEFDGKKRAS
jgi:hypothetical protein